MLHFKKAYARFIRRVGCGTTSVGTCVRDKCKFYSTCLVCLCVCVLTASRFSCLPGSPLVMTVHSSSLCTCVCMLIEFCHLETAVGSALNMLITPYTRELQDFSEPSGHPYSGLAVFGTPQFRGSWVHWNPVVPSHRVTNLYVWQLSDYPWARRLHNGEWSPTHQSQPVQCF